MKSDAKKSPLAGVFILQEGFSDLSSTIPAFGGFGFEDFNRCLQLL